MSTLPVTLPYLERGAIVRLMSRSVFSVGDVSIHLPIGHEGSVIRVHYASGEPANFPERERLVLVAFIAPTGDIYNLWLRRHKLEEVPSL